MTPKFTHWMKTALEVLFPPICAGCQKILLSGNGNGGVCSACLATFIIPEAFTCPICRGRIPRLQQGLPFVGSLCHQKAQYILLACSNYEQPVAQNLIRQLKFERRASLADALGEIATLALGNTSSSADLLVPTPLSSQRLRERGFNQAELIASEISRRTGIVCDASSLKRNKHTDPQTHLKTWEERRNNLKNVFEVTEPKLLSGKNIILIDDVWTSGATMNDAARALREAGAKRIIGLALSRAH